MAFITPHRRAPRFGVLVGSSVYGALLTAAGLGIAYLVLATPLTEMLSAHQLAASGRMPISFGIASISLIAGGALLLAGTNRLAVTLAQSKTLRGLRGPGARALASVADVAVFSDVVTIDGRLIPEIAIGPFGVAVIHALPSSRDVRQVSTAWEIRTQHGWVPMENPLDLVMRDAERVRRWLSMGDLDFVVRVYGALIVRDRAVPRSAACAVLTSDQVSAWIGALPRQRSLTTARRLRLRALASAPAPPIDVGLVGGW